MVERADGLFILAKFMLADVNRAKRPSTILKSLETYPQEINGMLHKTLENLAETISEEDASDLNEMLQWIAYAEQSLTLEQLEALLILRFDETPFRFEDTLRGQYACFFELEREDGLTTDDLIKDHERRRRSKSRDSTPSDRPRRSSSVTRESPTRRALSPAQKLTMATRRRTSPVNLPSSPVERAPRSPVFRALRSEAPDLDEMEFRSKKSTTTVTFFHNSVREFFRDENTDKITCGTDGIALGVKTSEAKLHILKTCLRIFNDEAWFKSKSLPHEKHHPMKQYAAWYWQEHLASLDPSKVSKEDKKTIGQHVYKMLTDERIIYEWSIMYEKNDEGSVVFTDKNLKALRQWMEDTDVLAGLEPAAREWAQKSATKPTGIVENIGRYYAKGWLDANFDRYIPTKFCFKIVQCLAFMELGHKWSDSQNHWTDIPFAERVKTATDWAKIDVTAHSFRRVGSTYLTAGLYNDALEQYNEALKLDSNSVESLGRKAFCLFRDKRYADAMDVALECEGIESKSITSGKLSKDELAASKWRLYRDRVIIAQSSYHIGDVGTSIAYYHKAIASAAEATLRHSERFEASIGLLEVLAEENRHADMMKLLETMSLQPTGPRHEQSQLVDLLIFLYNKPLLLESIPKAACREDKDAFLLDRLEICISVAHSVRDALKELYLRLALGSTYIYGHDTEEALKVFEQISLVEYRPRGNVATRQAHANSFQKLAGIYKQKVLHAGITSVAADEWIRRLEEIQTKQSAHENQDLPTSMLGSDVNVAAIFLARFYRLRGRKAEAERLLAALIVDSCEILEDEELKNDEYALENLLRLFTAADEVTDAKALAVSMRRLDPDASIHTPLDSPVQQRGRPIEPKLPDIQSSNRSCAQCLKNITPREEFHFCRYCLDAFCTPCLDNVIKKPDNKGKGGMGAGESVVCRADHEWFGVPPLRRVLHTGQMLFDGGEKRGFVEWREEIKERWVKRVR
jgi:tetratricopeptide (TPR) repeat protein